jgi:hypothetical protein
LGYVSAPGSGLCVRYYRYQWQNRKLLADLEMGARRMEDRIGGVEILIY